MAAGGFAHVEDGHARPDVARVADRKPVAG
jgi:hypothetical protein